MTKAKYAPETRELEEGIVKMVAVRINVVSGNCRYSWLLRDSAGTDLGLIRWYIDEYAFIPRQNSQILTAIQLRLIADYCDRIQNERVPT